MNNMPGAGSNELCRQVNDALELLASQGVQLRDLNRRHTAFTRQLSSLSGAVSSLARAMGLCPSAQGEGMKRSREGEEVQVEGESDEERNLKRGRMRTGSYARLAAGDATVELPVDAASPSTSRGRGRGRGGRGRGRGRGRGVTITASSGSHEEAGVAKLPSAADLDYEARVNSDKLRDVALTWFGSEHPQGGLILDAMMRAWFFTTREETEMFRTMVVQVLGLPHDAMSGKTSSSTARPFSTEILRDILRQDFRYAFSRVKSDIMTQLGRQPVTAMWSMLSTNLPALVSILHVVDAEFERIMTVVQSFTRASDAVFATWTARRHAFVVSNILVILVLQDCSKDMTRTFSKALSRDGVNAILTPPILAGMPAEVQAQAARVNGARAAGADAPAADVSDDAGADPGVFTLAMLCDITHAELSKSVEMVSAAAEASAAGVTGPVPVPLPAGVVMLPTSTRIRVDAATAARVAAAARATLADAT